MSRASRKAKHEAWLNMSTEQLSSMLCKVKGRNKPIRRILNNRLKVEQLINPEKFNEQPTGNAERRSARMPDTQVTPSNHNHQLKWYQTLKGN